MSTSLRGEAMTHQRPCIIGRASLERRQETDHRWRTPELFVPCSGPRSRLLVVPEAVVRERYPHGVWQRAIGSGFFRAVALDVTEGPKFNEEMRGQGADRYLSPDQLLDLLTVGEKCEKHRALVEPKQVGVNQDEESWWFGTGPHPTSNPTQGVITKPPRLLLTELFGDDPRLQAALDKARELGLPVMGEKV
jgi:hypothetical protein